MLSVVIISYFLHCDELSEFCIRSWKIWFELIPQCIYCG